MEILFPEEGTYVIGATGMGKSTFLTHRIVADWQGGVGFVLIDPKIDLADHVYSVTNGEPEMLDVEAGNFAINLFHLGDDEPDVILDRTMQVFTKVFGLSRDATPRLRQYLRNTARLLILTGGTLSDVPTVLLDPKYRQHLLDQIPGKPKLKQFWAYHATLSQTEQRNRIESTYDRIDEFLGSDLAHHIFGSKENSINWVKTMDDGRSAILRLSPLYEQLSSLVGAVVMGQLAAAAFSRRNDNRFAIYCDEYHRFATPATDDLLVQGRSFHIATTVAHQYRHQLDGHARGATLQVGNVVVFRVAPPDHDELAGLFKVPEEEPRVIGRIAKQVFDPNPIQALLHNSHENEHVRKLVRQELRPFLDRTKMSTKLQQAFMQNEDRHHRNVAGISQLDERDLLATRQMNGYLVDMMERKLLTLADRAAPIAAIIDMFATELAILDEHMSDLTDQEYDDLVLDVIDFMGSPSNPKTPEFSRTRAFSLQRRSNRYYSNVAETDAPAERIRRAEIGQANAERVAYLFWDLGIMLRKYPIMVETDQFEEIHERPRSVEDRISEMANELVALPRGVAMVKVRVEHGYHQERLTLPPPPDLGSVTWSSPAFSPDELDDVDEPEHVVIHYDEPPPR